MDNEGIEYTPPPGFYQEPSPIMELAFAEDSAKLLERVEKMEARQRANKIHDPECAAFVPKNEGFQFNVYMKPQPCNCWLSESSTTQKESNL